MVGAVDELMIPPSKRIDSTCQPRCRCDGQWRPIAFDAKVRDFSVGTPVVDLLLKLEFWNESKTCKFPTQNTSGIFAPWPWEDR